METTAPRNCQTKRSTWLSTFTCLFCYGLKFSKGGFVNTLGNLKNLQEAMVELQVNVPTTCPAWLFSLYAANTVLLIASNIFALMVSTCLLPRMSAISEEYNVADLHEVPTFSPHDRLKGLVSLSAGLAHVFGLFLFLIELILLNWVKFWDFSIPAATAGSITMVPFMILFAISLMHLKKLLAEHKCSFRESKIKEVQTTFKNYL